ncbi:MAG: ABC transporter permease [Actinomycetota bacterium]
MKTETEPAREERSPAPPGRRRFTFLREALVLPLLALIAALIIGAVVMVLADPDTLREWASFTRDPGGALSATWELVGGAYEALFRSSLGSTNAISETLVATTPLLLAGLSVALAFRAGLFNIGAEGQSLLGIMFGAYVGFTFDLPLVLHLPAALIAGFAGGALWGAIPGWFKAKTGAHEVITTIMLNFIAVNLVTYMLKSTLFQRAGRTDPISKQVDTTAQLPQLGDYRVHLGILVALLMAFVVWWLLFRTTVGFRFRAVGANPHAASYAGMSVGATYIGSMAIAGGLSGLAGTTNLLGITYSVTPGFLGYGFDAIALALLGRTHPAGVVLAAILFGALRAGSVGMQAATSIPVDIIVVIQALIIMFVAAPALVREIFRVRAAPTTGPAETFTKSWAG